MVPYDRFTDSAKAALTRAQEQAQSAGAPFIGTEHLLLGLMLAEDGMASAVLGALGIEVETARAAIETVSGRNPATGGGRSVPTPQVRTVIELAFDEARSARSSRVATEHLLLGLLRQAEGTGPRALVHLGAGLEQVRAKVDELAQDGAADPRS
jgi:ATP-dependent Clp protease ATP-binding subunit ClpC